MALSFVRQADDIRVLRTFLDSHGSPARIIATHPLESMIASPKPARREVSDVWRAVRETTDAFMISGEPTTVACPPETLQVLRKIIASTAWAA